MKKRHFGFIGGVLLAAALAIAADAQVTPPQVTQIGPNDLFQDVVGGVPTAGNQYATSAQIGVLGATQAGALGENALIGGDFTENLFQRGTTSGTITTTATYTADRWFAWSGASTNTVVSKQTGASDITQGYGASMRVARSSGAGVVQVCVGQEVETVNSFRFQGQTVELDFHALAGSAFSSATSALQVYITYGTGTDDGSSKMAFGINAGGGGGSGWTGQTLLGGANGYAVPISAAWNRYSIAAPIPVTATEVGVAVCYTPVGTGASNDYFELAGVQLVVNPALTTVAGSAGVLLNTNDLRTKSFARRSQALETLFQERYYYQMTEGAGPTVRGLCTVTTVNTVLQCQIRWPVPMRVGPTVTYAAGFAVPTTTAETALTACTALAASATISALVNSTTDGTLAQCTSGGTTAAVGLMLPLFDNGGTGTVKASAEL